VFRLFRPYSIFIASPQSPKFLYHKGRGESVMFYKMLIMIFFDQN
jgi:hypothetical protein